MQLKEKEEKDRKDIRNLFRKSPNKDGFFQLSTQIMGKGKHSADKKFQSLAMRGKKLLTWTYLYSPGIVTEKACSMLK